MNRPSALVSKLWYYCDILRDDGLSYGDYVEQLAFLLLPKMVDKQSETQVGEVPNWPVEPRTVGIVGAD